MIGMYSKPRLVILFPCLTYENLMCVGECRSYRGGMVAWDVGRLKIPLCEIMPVEMSPKHAVRSRTVVAYICPFSIDRTASLCVLVPSGVDPRLLHVLYERSNLCENAIFRTALYRK